MPFHCYNLFMEIFDIFGNAHCNFMAYSAAAMFAVFLIFARIFNMAAGEACHARLNRANAAFLAVYSVIAAAYCVINKCFSLEIAAAMLGGIFIFVSLHQIYFMALIGLAKKSVSAGIVEKAMETGNIPEKTLKGKFSGNSDAIRMNRLEQMKFLGLAAEKNETYKISGRGRFFNGLGNLILKIWGLERL